MSSVSERPPNLPADERNYDSVSLHIENSPLRRRIESSGSKNSRLRHLEYVSDSGESTELSWKPSQSYHAIEATTLRETEDNKVSSSNKPTVLGKPKRYRTPSPTISNYRDKSREAGRLRNEKREDELKRVRKKYGTPPSTPYFADKIREADRIRRGKRKVELDHVRKKCSTPSPPPTTTYYDGEERETDRIGEEDYVRRKHRTPTRISKDNREYGRRREGSCEARSRRRPPSPDAIRKPRTTEKVPYYVDQGRERDRLRRKYKTPTPERRRKLRILSSRSSRRRRSCSRRTCSRSRSRSKSHHRRSSSPKIKIIPVPVPVYNPPFDAHHLWPRLPLPPNDPAMLPYAHQPYRRPYTFSDRMAGFGRPPPPPPSMYYLPRFNPSATFAPSRPMGPYMSGRYRFPPCAP